MKRTTLIMLLFLSNLAFSQNEERDLTGEDWYLGSSVGGNLTIGSHYYFLDSVTVKTIYFHSHSHQFAINLEGKYTFDNIKNELFIEYDSAKTKLPNNGHIQMVNQIKDKKTDYFKIETINDSLYKVYHTNNWVGDGELYTENEIKCISFLKKETTNDGYYLSYHPKNRIILSYIFMRKNRNKK